MEFLMAWRDWNLALLSTASTRLLLNGMSGDTIHHGRGLCQGDTLSPMMFQLVMKVLNTLFCKADEYSLLQDMGTHSLPHRASFYVDDLILFIHPEV
jgi:hypothetical protein